MSIFNILNVDVDYHKEAGVQSADIIYQTLQENNLKVICIDGRTFTVLNSSQVTKKYLNTIFKGKKFIGWVPHVNPARTLHGDLQISLEKISSSEKSKHQGLSYIHKKFGKIRFKTKFSDLMEKVVINFETRSDECLVEKYKRELLKPKSMTILSRPEDRIPDLEEALHNLSVKQKSEILDEELYSDD